jgi:hypothetical protein
MRKAKNAGAIPNSLAHKMVFCFNLICHLFGFFDLCFLRNIFRAIFASQNTIITMLLIALSWRAIGKKNDCVARIFCGLMLFKPQFALPLIVDWSLFAIKPVASGNKQRYDGNYTLYHLHISDRA